MCRNTTRRRTTVERRRHACRDPETKRELAEAMLANVIVRVTVKPT